MVGVKNLIVPLMYKCPKQSAYEVVTVVLPHMKITCFCLLILRTHIRYTC